MAVKNPLKTFKEKNIAETLAETSHSAQKLTQDELNNLYKTFMRQALQVEEGAQNLEAQNEKLSGDLQEGQEISFEKNHKEKAEGDPEIEYERKILRYHEESSQKEASQINQKLEEIRVELKKITETSKELEAQFKETSSEILMKTQKPGKYHEGFAEWLFSQIKQVSARLESSIWATTLMSKSAKKDFWSKAKAHGTSFTLSAERYMVQQTG